MSWDVGSRLHSATSCVNNSLLTEFVWVCLYLPDWAFLTQSETSNQKSGTDTSMWTHLKSMDPLAKCQWIQNWVVAAIWRRDISQRQSEESAVPLLPVLSYLRIWGTVWARKMGVIWVYLKKVLVSVFHEINFSKKKLRLCPRTFLQGIYNSDPKAFFHGTSLEGPST